MHIHWAGTEKKRPMYYHHECWEFKNNEVKELDELYNVIKEMHKIIDVPKAFFVHLQNLRNGTITLHGKEIKKFKKGVPYHIIKKAYEMSRKKIQWAKGNKTFKSSISELMYGFKIIESKINDAFKEIKKQKIKENLYVNPDHSYSDYEVEPLKKFPKS